MNKDYLASAKNTLDKLLEINKDTVLDNNTVIGICNLCIAIAQVDTMQEQNKLLGKQNKELAKIAKAMYYANANGKIFSMAELVNFIYQDI